jgi:hypothetical protein
MTARKLALACLLALAACGTPQEQCIRSATRDLAEVERLLVEVQGNLSRGYAIESRTVTQWEWRMCRVRTTTQTVGQMCWEPVDRTVRRSVPIDPEAERRKLAGLQERYATLTRQAEPAIAACRAAHPE